jgi:hypothetical protein
MSGGAGAPNEGMRPAKDAGPPTRLWWQFDDLAEAAA